MAGRRSGGGWSRRQRSMGWRKPKGEPAARRPRMDEDAGDPMEASPTNPFAVRKGCRQEHLEKAAAIHLGVRADAVAGSRRHHHAERAVLRAAPWRGADHRSGTAPVDAPWTGRASADLHHGRHSALSIAVADPFPRVLRQPGLHQAVWQDRLRSGRAVELRGVDRGQPEAGVAGSGIRPEAKWLVAEGADAAAHDAQHPDREMPRRRDAGVQPERRAAASAAGLSAASAGAGLRRQHEREMAAPPASRGASRPIRARKPRNTPT